MAGEIAVKLEPCEICGSNFAVFDIGLCYYCTGMIDRYSLFGILVVWQEIAL